MSTPLHTNAATNVSAQYHYNIGAYTTLTKDASDNITAITDLTKVDPTIFKLGKVYTTENRPAYKPLTNGELTATKGETTGVIYRVVAKKSGSNVGTFFKYGTTISTNWATIAALNSSLLQTTPDAVDYPSLRAQGVQVYEGGVMYYSHFIKDVNTNHQLGGKNYYGVFRNSSYQLKINKFSALGDDVPGGGTVDPEDPDGPNPPIDNELAYMTVTITVNPWVLNTIGIDF